MEYKHNKIYRKSKKSKTFKKFKKSKKSKTFKKFKKFKKAGSNISLINKLISAFQKCLSIIDSDNIRKDDKITKINDELLIIKSINTVNNLVNVAKLEEQLQIEEINRNSDLVNRRIYDILSNKENYEDFKEVFLTELKTLEEKKLKLLSQRSKLESNIYQKSPHPLSAINMR